MAWEFWEPHPPLSNRGATVEQYSESWWPVVVQSRTGLRVVIRALRAMRGSTANYWNAHTVRTWNLGDLDDTSTTANRVPCGGRGKPQS